MGGGDGRQESMKGENPGKVSHIYTAGDCVTLRRMVDAMDEGVRTGLGV